MSEPIVFISRSRLTPGRRADFVPAFQEVLADLEMTRPRTAVMAAYLDEAGTEISIVHVFSDGAGMADHFVGSEDRIASVAGVITLTGFEVYGPAPSTAIEQLGREAARGGFDLIVRSESIGGFVRGSG